MHVRGAYAQKPRGRDTAGARAFMGKRFKKKLKRVPRGAILFQFGGAQ
jgi:hypothetical protein